jgi:hypothetical protein
MSDAKTRRAMSALFPPWTNTALTAALIAMAIGIGGAIAIPMIAARMPDATGQDNPIVQPIAFDHRHHVRDDGIACLYCHDGAERSPYAGIPPNERCLGCHAQIWNDSAQLAPLQAPIAWRRVSSLADFVYFDHSIHVANKIDCAECHGDVGSMAAVYQTQPLTMGWCVSCHRARSAPTQCSACHR